MCDLLSHITDVFDSRGIKYHKHEVENESNNEEHFKSIKFNIKTINDEVEFDASFLKPSSRFPILNIFSYDVLDFSSKNREKLKTFILDYNAREVSFGNFGLVKGTSIVSYNMYMPVINHEKMIKGDISRIVLYIDIIENNLNNFYSALKEVLPDE